MPIVWIALIVATAASAAALYGHYRDLPAWMTGPTICRLDGNGCAVLFRTPRASLLGVPNAALGLLLYAILTVGVIERWPPAWMLALTTPAIAMSIFLAGSLVRNRRECRICWTGHAANLVLFASFAVRAL
ncbi:MAG TPA: vitamin K epoxide reductase family protein [Vicinamibacterales bacterium]|nr:vitamin K epoxide reductase family protein [Vicinamibacterales bacterium]